MNKITFANMPKCVADAHLAINASTQGPADPTDYVRVIDRLKRAHPRTPRLYRRTMLRPYLSELEDLGAYEFAQILLLDPNRVGEAGLLLDIAHALLQNAENFKQVATDAFQEVVADLYDGFLSAEDRIHVKPPDRGVVSPMVKWGSPEVGPYTWPVDDTAEYGAMAGVVSLPPSHARRGLAGWSALAHETAGHDILHADDGLLLELKQKLRDALEAGNLSHGLPAYWADRIDETASDVLGILNMGPAAAIGIIAYFRGWSNSRQLSVIGPEEDVHPADVLRGWLAAETVRLLSFEGHEAWAEAIGAETDTDAGAKPIRLAGTEVKRIDATKSARIVARTLVLSPLSSLEGRSLGQIQDWRDRDEQIVGRIREALRSDIKAKRYRRLKGHYAAHVVAAAVYEATQVRTADLPKIQERMLALLKHMHNANPAWGPLFLSRILGVKRQVAHRMERARRARPKRRRR